MEEKEFFIKYDHLEKTYWWHLARKRIVVSLLGKFLSKRSGNPNILDIGCGPGANLTFAKGLGNIFGLDLSAEAILMAKEAVGAKVVRGNTYSLPYKDGFFDVVMVLDVLEHLEEQEKCLEEINRVCAANGLVVIAVPAYQSLYSYTDAVQGHIRRYCRKEVESMIIRNGFRIIKSTYFNMFLFPLIVQRFIKKKAFTVAEDPLELICPNLPPLINKIFRTLFGLEVYFLKFMNFSFGGSVLCIGKKSPNGKS